MSIQVLNNLPWKQYTATTNGENTYTYTYIIFEKDDLDVYVNGALTTDFTVNKLNDNAGGVCTINTPAIMQGDVITLERNVTAKRTTNFQPQKFNTTTLNNQFNEVFAILQQIQRDNLKTIRFDASSTTTLSPILPTPVDGRSIVFDGTDGSMRLSQVDFDTIEPTIINARDEAIANVTATKDQAVSDVDAIRVATQGVADQNVTDVTAIKNAMDATALQNVADVNVIKNDMQGIADQNVIDVTAIKDVAQGHANNASTSETNAQTYEGQAQVAMQSAQDAQAQAELVVSGATYETVNYSADFTISTNNNGTLVAVDTTAGDVTITLPLASGLANDIRFGVVMVAGTNKVILQPSGAETVAGNPTLELIDTALMRHIRSDNSTGLWVASKAGTSLAGEGVNSVAIGAGSAADNLDQISIGTGAGVGVTREGSISIGKNAKGNWTRAIAIGENSFANATDAIIIGKDSTGTGMTFGKGCTSNSSLALAMGAYTSASGANAFAIGRSSSASGSSSLAIGSFVNAIHNYSYAIGYNLDAEKPNQMIFGDNAFNTEVKFKANAIVNRYGNSIDNLAINNVTTTTHTLALSDQYVRLNNASPITLTVPDQATTDFDIGTQILIRQVHVDGQVTVVPTAGVTINTNETLKLRKDGSVATLIKVGADEWDLVGDLEAL